MFLDHQIRFLKDHVTEEWSNDTENSGNKLHLKITLKYLRW